MITGTPVAKAVNTPDSGSMLATGGTLSVHIPPGVESMSVIVESIQTSEAPVIGAGTGFTVNAIVAMQPAAEV